MLDSERHSVYNIESEENIPFDIDEYSQFKFGSGEITNNYADKITDLISNYIHNLKTNREIIIYPSPYAHIPTASCHMTYAIVNKLKSIYPNLNLRLSKINRKNTYPNDYGALNKEERYDLIKNDTYELTEYPQKESLLMFIDDISVTGTHQIIIEEILRAGNICNEKLFFYYAKVANDDIHPSIENKLNYSSVNNLQDLVEIFTQKDFLLNTRFTKKILSLKKEEIQLFVQSFDSIYHHKNIRELVEGGFINNYDKMDLYKNNLIFLKEILMKQKLTTD